METSPIRILHVITGLDTGGAERQLSELVCHSDSPRFRHAVVSLMGEGSYGGAVRAAGVEFFTLNCERGRISPTALYRLARLMRTQRPDIVQTWLYHADLAGTLAARLAGSPSLLWSLRCSDMELEHYSRLTRCVVAMLTWLSSWPSCIVANSMAGLNAHRSLGYRPTRSCIIPNGVDTEVFRPDDSARAALRTEWRADPHEFLVGCVARYDRQKDHRGLLQAFALLSSQARLVLVGKGIDAGNPRLAADITAAGIDRSRLLLLGERRDVARVHSALDLLVLGSAFGEGFSNVIGEAMACELPVVCTDIGDAADILRDCGIVVPPKDPARLAKAISSILAMSGDERREFGARGRRRIENHYAVPRMVEAYSKLYTEIAKPRREHASG